MLKLPARIKIDVATAAWERWRTTWQTAVAQLNELTEARHGAQGAAVSTIDGQLTAARAAVTTATHALNVACAAMMRAARDAIAPVTE